LSQGKTLPSVLFIFSTLSFMDLAIPVVIIAWLSNLFWNLTHL
jgi:hypothetical protein